MSVFQSLRLLFLIWRLKLKGRLKSQIRISCYERGLQGSRIVRNGRVDMRLGRINAAWIGARIRKPTWGTCSMTVLDVGQFYVIGQIFDHTSKQVVAMDLFPLDEDDWELYVDAKKVIDMLPIKGEDNGRGNKKR